MTHVALERFLLSLLSFCLEVRVIGPPMLLGADGEARRSYEEMGVQLRTEQGREMGVWLATRLSSPAMT